MMLECSVSQLRGHNFGASVVAAVYDRRLYSFSRATCLQRDTIKPAVIDRRYKGPLPDKYNVHAIERHYTSGTRFFLEETCGQTEIRHVELFLDSPLVRSDSRARQTLTLF